MQVTVAKTAGFCMGVKRAVDITKDTATSANGKNVCTLGELIHNRQVVSELEDLGVEVAHEIPVNCTVVIRAHGVTQECRDKLYEGGNVVVDATCPHVLSSQKTIAAFSKNGGTVIILGDCKHPEVVGLCGYATSDVFVIESIEDLDKLDIPEKFLFIAQTTFSQELFDNISRVLKENYPLCKIVDSICSATQKRQAEARALAQKSDTMIVVGGKNSANTMRLVEIGKEEGCQVYHVERVQELNKDDFLSVTDVAVTAGASTPVSAVDDVVEFLKS